MTSHPLIAPGDHKAYMKYAVEQARLSPPSPSKFCVGAVLVDADKNEILATGYSEELPRDRPGDPGSTHAEHCCFIKVADRYGIHDFDIAKVLPPNTVLYTTMEPCNERLSGNRTCVERILGLNGAIKVVYVGIGEPDTFVKLNEGIKRLEDAGVKVSYVPSGCKVVSTVAHAMSFWANTGRIDVEFADGTPQSYFIKVISKETGKDMMHSEFESMKAIHAIVPDFVPRPIAWGTYQTIPEAHFFLCEFRDFDDEMPEPGDFATRLAKLHRESQSPECKFGFHLTTYAGNLPQMVEWESSWETFFTRSLRHALDLEIKAKGSDPELDTLLPILFDTVIPRLLRPLETNGRSVKPSLVHGDLWYANSGVEMETNNSIIFDACCFYAHNEWRMPPSNEFGQWRPACNRFDEKYLTVYQKHVEKSDPVEDYDGRIDLYKLRFNTHVLALFVDNMAPREQYVFARNLLPNRVGLD
ncbi:Fructosamine kinase-domain-containing protein [Achaetomium macrosporum]|uniref:protein-ribulosamine 3-kinase n=1 Tax=Achaetomium macrosporum TaxID=79813 RepID=A0AAN7C4S3_9PEZI|nr:Fructosamine kinase-domain-containing protein [Achaetomium macrosporum]